MERPGKGGEDESGGTYHPFFVIAGLDPAIQVVML
jgi:hypothetical protein